MSEDGAVQTMSGVDGWFSPDEARILYRAAREAVASRSGAIVEIGSYKGRSTVVLASVVRDHCFQEPVHAIDPHEGELSSRRVSPTFEEFQRNIAAAGLSEHVRPVRKRSTEVDWSGPISLLLIDGLHDARSVGLDYAKYSPFVPVGGLIAFHDYRNRDFPAVRHFVDRAISDGALEIHSIAPADCPENTLVVTRKCPRISIIIPTCGRESLADAIKSCVQAGLTPYDEILIVGDGPQPLAASIAATYAKGLPIRYFEHGPTRMVGAAQRMLAMTKATGTHLAFIDDDDVYLPDALEVVRAEILKTPNRPLVFKERSCVARHPWGVIWKNPALLCGNVGTQGIVVPNDKSRLGYWDNCYSSDYTFLRTTVDRYPNKDADVVWVDKIIAELH